MIVPSKSTIEKQAEETYNLMTEIKSELEEVLHASVQSAKSNLISENAELKKKIEQLKNTLAKYEGSPSPIPAGKAEKKDNSSAPVEKKIETLVVPPKTKEKEAKVPKPSKPLKSDPADSLPVDVCRLDFRIGHIVSVEKHPDADSLYVEKIELGESQPRTVVSGLVKHMPPEELQGKLVVILCNLKPAKMRGVTSEAMVMCASTPEKVEVLIPPEGCVPGDLVEFEGYPRSPDAVLNPKKKVFEACAPDLKTDGKLTATYKGVPFVVPGKGRVATKTLANVQIK